jgi:hypothetical protein
MKIRKNVSELLYDCMKTVKEIEPNKEAVAKYLSDYYGEYVDPNKIIVESYGIDSMDTRIDWNTHLVSIIDYCPVGFTDGPLVD